MAERKVLILFAAPTGGGKVDQPGVIPLEVCFTPGVMLRCKLDWFP